MDVTAPIIISLIGAVATLLTSVVSVTWRIGTLKSDLEGKADSVGRLILEKEMAIKAMISTQVDVVQRNAGESIAALRQKIVEVELWGRDNFVRRGEFQNVVDALPISAEATRLEFKKIGEELTAIRFKAETMWAFQMRRAVSEVVTTGVGKMESPIKFSEMAIRSMGPIKHDLIGLYARKRPTDDLLFLLDIEAEFGSRLLERVCIPYGLSHGACLLLALSIAKQVPELDFSIPEVTASSVNRPH
jgi:hypothetical protein